MFQFTFDPNAVHDPAFGPAVTVEGSDGAVPSVTMDADGTVTYHFTSTIYFPVEDSEAEASDASIAAAEETFKQFLTRIGLASGLGDLRDDDEIPDNARVDYPQFVKLLVDGVYAPDDGVANKESESNAASLVMSANDLDMGRSAYIWLMGLPTGPAHEATLEEHFKDRCRTLGDETGVTDDLNTALAIIKCRHFRPEDSAAAAGGTRGAGLRKVYKANYARDEPPSRQWYLDSCEASATVFDLAFQRTSQLLSCPVGEFKGYVQGARQIIAFCSESGESKCNASRSEAAEE